MSFPQSFFETYQEGMAATPHLEIEHQKKLRDSLITFLLDQKLSQQIILEKKAGILNHNDWSIEFREIIRPVRVSFVRQYVCYFFNEAGTHYMASTIVEFDYFSHDENAYPMMDLFRIFVQNDKKRLKAIQKTKHSSK